MSGGGDTLGSRLLAAAVLVLAPVCCLGLPLLVAAGVSLGLAAAVGGLLLAALVALAVGGLLVLRARRRGLLALPSRPKRTTRA
ncbi:MAG TPA: hypothetical protein VNK94_04525 [Gaiellaceae bacterium]|jgi:hypothetical protein|nr:hypothetical protein [Gaiellaceae bacterium]